MAFLTNLWRHVSGRAAREAAAAQQAVAHRAFLDALQAVVQIVTAQAQANEALAGAIQEWLKLFHTAQQPQGWTHNDLSEALQEGARLKDMEAAGFPTHYGPLDQLLFTATAADRLPDLS